MLDIICRAITVAVLLLLVCVIIRHEFAFGRWGNPKYENDVSLSSPSGRYVVVVLRGDISAISDFSYRLYVFPHDLAPLHQEKGVPVSLLGIWNDRRYLVYTGNAIPAFRWTSDHEIEIDLNDLYDEVAEFHPSPALGTPPKDSPSGVLVSLIPNKSDNHNTLP